MPTDRNGAGTLQASAPVPILTYHAIRQASVGPIARYTVDPATLERQLDAFLDTGWQFASLLDLTSPSPQSGRRVVVTVDDGYRDFLETALPVFASRHVTGTMFVPAALVGRDDAWMSRESPTRYPLMRDTEVRQLADAGWDVGAHGATHAEMDLLPADSLRKEVGEARTLLSEVLGRTVETFAYPYGYHSSRVRKAVRSAGYRMACAVSNRVAMPGDDVFALPRLSITADMTPQDLMAWANAPRTRPGDLVAEAKHQVWRWKRRLDRVVGR